MVHWFEFEAADPDFAARVRELFDAHEHKTMATIRKDGSPRISGTCLGFEEGDASIGMSVDSVKCGDLLGDPRIAIHTQSEDPPKDNPSAWTGDAKMSGRAVSAPDSENPERPSGRFTIDIDEVVFTKVGEPADHLVIESWHPVRGRRIRHRA